MSDAKPAGEVKKPAFVKGRAAVIWDEKAPATQAAGLLTAQSAEMFGIWCALLAEFERSPRKFQTSRLSQMRQLAKHFGLVPAGGEAQEPAVEEPGEEFFRRPRKLKAV